MMAALATLLGGVYWHKKRSKEGKSGVEPSHIIAFCLSSAALLMMVAAGAYIWQQFFSQKSQSAELLAGTATAVIIRDPKIVGSNDPNSLFTFYGTFAASGTLARIYIDFDRPDRNEVKRGNDSVVTYPRRVKLTEFINFTKAEPLKVALISFDPPDARNILRWGTLIYGSSEESDRFTLTDPIDARVTVIDTNGSEQHYSFWLRPKIGIGMQLYPPMPKLDISNIMLITQDMVNTQLQWK